LETLTNIAKQTQEWSLSTIDESFLDGSFTYKEITEKMIQSTLMVKPPSIDQYEFNRSLKATSLLVQWCTSLLGISTNTKYDLQSILNWLLIEGRCSGSDGVSAIMKYLVISSTIPHVPPPHQPFPLRLWKAYAALYGCQPIQKSLATEEPMLFRKVMNLAANRNGPLFFIPDPMALIEEAMKKIQAEPHKINEPVGFIGNEISSPVILSGYSILSLAIFAGDDQRVRSLLEDPNVDINQSSSQQETPLFLAAQSSHRGIFHLLLDAEADVRIVTQYHETVLHAISSFDDALAAEIASELVSRGVSLTELSDEVRIRERSDRTNRSDVSGSAVRWAVMLSKPLFLASLLDLHEKFKISVPDLDEVLEHASASFKPKMLAELITRYPHLSRLSSSRSLSNDQLDHLLSKTISNHQEMRHLLLHGSKAIGAQKEAVELLIKHGARPLRPE
jgi:hypothetical protein